MGLSSDWDYGFFPLPIISLQVGPMTGKHATISSAQRENYYLEVIKMMGGFKQLNILNCCLKKMKQPPLARKLES